ncbi:EcsC family protein [Peribacillus frigoritolerans]|uniref:EcsC family protein n=1 Tax=Peribacillus frigoritolerans TaxID=450367 RepID=UPI0039A10D3F
MVNNFGRNEPSEYEQTQISEIIKWINTKPSVVSQVFGKALEPLAWTMRKVIPVKAIQGLLDGANEVGRLLTDKKDIIRKAKVTSIEDLQYLDLKISDKLADSVHNWAIGVAITEGGTAGAFGLPGAFVDIPAIITLALRTIHKIGICYGYECNSQDEKEFVLGILSASGANSMEEKNIAIGMLKSIEVKIAKQTWKSMTQKAINKPLSQEAAVIALRNLSKQLGVNLTKRKALQAIPIIGAVVGSSVNGWYIKDVGWAARRAFQQRWLLENGKIIDME